MKTLLLKIVSLSFILCLFPFGYLSANEAETSNSTSNTFEELEWVDLMPADDLEALLNPPDAITNIADGSAQDNINSLSDIGKENADVSRYYEALKSSRVVDALHHKKIKLPGFVVPIISDENNKITEFFIVPYFGACLHMPPPPPNQIIHAKVEKGFELNSLYDPFWFEGELIIAQTQHAMGESAYSLDVNSIVIYEE